MVRPRGKGQKPPDGTVILRVMGRPPRCLDCDYALRGLDVTGECPECGRVFDLGSPGSFHLGQPMPGWARWWVKPVGVPTMCVAALAWLFLSLLVAEPGANYMLGGACALAVCGTPVVLVIVVARADSRWRVARRYGRRASEFGNEAWQGWSLVGSFFLLVLLTIFAVPTRLWFWPFVSSFNDLADKVVQVPIPAGGPRPSLTRQVGPWSVRAEHLGDGIVVIHARGPLNFGGGGFSRAPEGIGMNGYGGGPHGALGFGWRYFTFE